MTKGLHKDSLGKIDNPHQWMIDDARMELIQQIKAEVERLKQEIYPVKVGEQRVNRGPNSMESAALGALNALMSRISTLQEQPVKHSVEDAMKELDKKIAKATKSWKGVDVDKMLAECRGYDEQPVCKGLKEEIEETCRFWIADSDDGKVSLDKYDIKNIARHFARCGAEHLKK